MNRAAAFLGAGLIAVTAGHIGALAVAPLAVLLRWRALERQGQG